MTTRHHIPALTLLVSFLALGCSSALSYRHDQHDDAPFDRYRTVAILQATDVGNFTRGELNEEQRTAARTEALAAFEAKGWTIVDDSDTADLVLVAGVGRRIRVEERIEGNPTMRFDTYEVDINEGTIVLDAWDRRTHEHVWHGQVIGAGDPPAAPERVAEGVRLLLSEFPAAGQGEPLPDDTSGGEEPAPDDAVDSEGSGDAAPGGAPAPEEEPVQG